MTALETLIAEMHGVTGDIAYGSAWSYKKVHKMAQIAIEAANGDEAVALAVVKAAHNFYGTKVD